MDISIVARSIIKTTTTTAIGSSSSSSSSYSGANATSYARWDAKTNMSRVAVVRMTVATSMWQVARQYRDTL